ncbi:MAG: TIGR03118 family protein [Steroidobacteraceae bacterium]
MKTTKLGLGASAAALLLSSCGGSDLATPDQSAKSGYASQSFVANAASYNPQLSVVMPFVDAWGVAIRPAGQPGHFWVLAGNKSYEYVGDVAGKVTAPCTALSVLCADLAPLPDNTISFPDFPLDPGSGDPDIINNHATGVAFNSVPANFVITQTPSAPSVNLTPVTAGAKFIFATNYGAIYAWTERKHATDSGYDRADKALKIFDTRDSSSDCGQFYGLTLSASAGRLYVADFGTDTSGACNNAAAVAAVPKSFRIRVFDKTLNANGTLNEISGSLNGGKAFVNPLVGDPANIKAGDYVPWNVAAIGTSIFVAYVPVQQDPDAADGVPLPANEVHAPGAGRIVEFDVDGKLIKVWNDGGRLNAPWGMAQAPANFGTASNQLLVGNFGDDDLGGSHGAITGFDMTKQAAEDVLRNPDGTPLLVPGIWGIVFGNGDTLGDANALYFAAGPQR